MLHLNQWQDGGGQGALVTAEDWNACTDPSLPKLKPGDRTPLVLGVDAGLRHDSFAIVGVSRDPARPDDTVAVRFCKVWTPERGQDIDFSGPGSPDQYVRDLCRDYNVRHIAFDEYQLASLAQGWLRDRVAWAEAFPQGHPRLLADSALYNAIKMRRVRHAGTEIDLRRHVLNAGFKLAVTEDTQLRIVKQNPRGLIDACVALSMARARCLYLNVAPRADERRIA
jgi:hypothetical protein